MTYYTRLLDLARVELVGASDAGIKQQLFWTEEEFFRVSSAWQETIPITLEAGETSYEIEPQENPPGVIIRLALVLDANNIPQPAMLPSASPLNVVLRDPPNDSGATLNVTVIKNVDQCRDVPEVPDWVYQLWTAVLVAGVIGRMKLQPDKSYTDVKGAAYHLRKFESGVAQARSAALRRNTFGLNAWSYPQQFRSRGQRGGVSVGNATSF